MDFTYKEFNTFVTQVASLITTMSTDPNDLQALTLSHILIGRPLTELPEHFSNIPANRLSSWQHISRSSAISGYTGTKNTLTNSIPTQIDQGTAYNQGRTNRHPTGRNPPAQQTTGRIYSGSDDIIRIVDVKTFTNCYKRNVRKLTPLPIKTDTDFP